MEQINYIENNRFWIARDRNDNLYLYRKQPDKKSDYFMDKDAFCLELNPSLFPEVTFENSPQEFQLVPSKEYDNLKDIREDWLKFIGYGPDSYDNY